MFQYVIFNDTVNDRRQTYTGNLTNLYFGMQIIIKKLKMACMDINTFQVIELSLHIKRTNGLLIISAYAQVHM